jgi:hypothetical protein
MDPQIEDYNDAMWAQAQQDEQRQLEEDPAYFEFLKRYEEMR